MKVGLIVRHAVTGADTLAELLDNPSGPGLARRVANIAEMAPEVGQTNGAEIMVAFRLTVARDRLTPEQRELTKLASHAREELDDILTFYEPRDFGPKTGMHWFLNNPTFQAWGADVIINLDGDQFACAPRQTIGAAINIAHDTVQGNYLYYQGARSVPVVLGADPQASRLRQIHEMVHSIAMGRDKAIAPNPPKGVTPAYAELGESTSGYYVLWREHQNFTELQRRSNIMFSAHERGKVFGRFTMEYALALEASLFGSTGSRYVPTRENKIYGNKTAKQEVEGAERLIKLSSADLTRSGASQTLTRAVIDPCTRAALARHYSAPEVDLVLGWMKAGLAHGGATA